MTGQAGAPGVRGDLSDPGSLTPAQDARATAMHHATQMDRVADELEASGLPNAAAFRRAVANEFRRMVGLHLVDAGLAAQVEE